MDTGHRQMLRQDPELESQTGGQAHSSSTSELSVGTHVQWWDDGNLLDQLFEWERSGLSTSYHGDNQLSRANTRFFSRRNSGALPEVLGQPHQSLAKHSEEYTALPQ